MGGDGHAGYVAFAPEGQRRNVFVQAAQAIADGVGPRVGGDVGCMAGVAMAVLRSLDTAHPASGHGRTVSGGSKPLTAGGRALIAGVVLTHSRSKTLAPAMPPEHAVTKTHPND